MKTRVLMPTPIPQTRGGGCWTRNVSLPEPGLTGSLLAVLKSRMLHQETTQTVLPSSGRKRGSTVTKSYFLLFQTEEDNSILP